MWRVCKKL